MKYLKALAVAWFFVNCSDALAGSPDQAQGSATAYDGSGASAASAAASSVYVSSALPGVVSGAEGYSVQTASANGFGALVMSQGTVTLGTTDVFETGTGHPGLAIASSTASSVYTGAYGSFSSQIYASATIQETANGFVTSGSAGQQTNGIANQGGVTSAGNSNVWIFTKGNNAIVESRAETLTQINSNGRASIVANDVAIALARVTQFGLYTTSIAVSNESKTPASIYTQTPATSGKSARVPPATSGQPGSLMIGSNADGYPNSGVLLAISPTVSASLGWGFNPGETEFGRGISLGSNAFEGGLTWKPSPFFQLSASVASSAGEPSAAFVALPDIRTYSVRAAYLPIPAVTVSAAAGLQEMPVGSGAEYEAPFFNALLSWRYNSTAQVYAALQYQSYTIDGQYPSSNDVRVMTGLRFTQGGQGFLESESLDSLPLIIADNKWPPNPEFTVSAGYSWFGLPDMKMVNSVGGQVFDQVLGQEKNGGGNLNGSRADARLTNFAEASLPDGSLASLGLSGFFATYEGTTRSRCMYSSATDCALVNVVDSNPNIENNTGPFGNLNVKLNRNVDYFGVALEARLSEWAGGGLKDEPLAPILSAFKAGLAVRGLDEAANLTSVDPLVRIPVRYNEELNTHYYGGYLGLEQKVTFGDSWTASIDATAGGYYAATGLQGRYAGYAVSFPTGYTQDDSNLNENLNKVSFIGTLRLDLKRQLGWSTAGVFVEGEYLSYVPHVLYNNNDQANGSPFGMIGTQVGTRISSADAFNYTAGLSLSVPLN